MNHTDNVTINDVDIRFPSVASLRAAHLELLKRRRVDGDTPEFLAEVAEFIRRGQATGALLDSDDGRWASQSLLDYWATLLYRAGHEPPETTLAEFDPALAPELAETQCPYLGLDAFGEANHNLFFGRQRLVEKLVDRLKETRLLAVVGPSGSGKSSLVLAGLLPALRAGALPQSQTWHYYPRLVPGSEPLANLARVTRPPEANRAAWVQAQVERLRQEPGHLVRLMAERGDTAAVLVIDQFEELFTLCHDEQARQAFVANILNLAQAPEAGHVVILTLRTDFEEQVPQLPALQSFFEQVQVRLLPLDTNELREVIEKPAELVGLRFEEGLVDALVQDIRGEPAALPLLQFTLLKLWENRERNRVTWESYNRLGGGRLALERSADTFYDKLIPEEQKTAQRILLRMVRPSTGLEVTSNRIQRETLYRAGEARDRVDRVLDKLIRARLVRLTEGETPADAQIEVAHEALVRNWPRLVGWLEEERVTLRRKLALTVAAEQWRDKGRDPGALWGGSLLDEALRYEDLNELELAFVQASLAAVEEAEREKEETRQRELAQARALVAEQQLRAEAEQLRAEAEHRRAEEQARAARHLRRLAIGLVGVILLAVVAAGWAVSKQQEAMQQARLAHSRELAARSLSLKDNKLDLALLLGVEAFQTYDTSEARSSLLTALEYSPHLNTFLYGHTNAVSSVAFNPQGQILASGNADGAIILWDMATRQPLDGPLASGTDVVNSVAFSPDGRTLASGSVDGTIILWDVAKRQRLGDPLANHKAAVWSVAFSPDGQTLASGSEDGTIMLWDAAKRQRLGDPLANHTTAVWSVAFSPDSQTLASGSVDGTIILWDVAKREQLGELIAGDTIIYSVAFSPDGRTLASSGSVDGTIILWDVAKWEQLGEPLAGHTSVVNSVAFSPDGRTLASASTDKTIILWDVAAGQPLGEPLAGHTDVVNSIAFNPDGRTLASGSGDKTVILWDVTAHRQFGPPLNGQDIMNSLALTPDGQTLASSRCGELDSETGACQQGEIRLWDVTTGKLLGPPLTGHTAAVRSVAFSPDGQTLASGSDDKTIILWNVSAQARTGEPLAGHTDVVNSVTFSPDGQTLASGSCGGLDPETGACQQGEIRLWNVATGRPLGEPYAGHTDVVNSVTFSPECASPPEGCGQTLASGSDDNTVILWNVATGQPLGEPFTGQAAGVASLAFSPDGKTLAVGNKDGTIILWDITTRQPLGEPFAGHTDGVASLAFSRDGKMLASGSWDHTLILWDVMARRQLGPSLTDHAATVWSVAFKPDSKTLLSSSLDNKIILWDTDPESWAAHACRMANHNLTQTEWAEFNDKTPYQRICPDLPPGQGAAPVTPAEEK